jgi:hypothetical protein
MQKKTKVDTRLCLNFCRYYKPGKNEELKCQGYIVVHEIMRDGKNLALHRSARTAIPDRVTQEELTGRICSVCAFRENDCDYILTGGIALACGGFVLLCHLLGTGELTLEEIGNAY